MRQRKRKTVWAYLDGKKLVNVVRAALDNNMMVDDLKAQLVKENPGHEVTFKVEWEEKAMKLEIEVKRRRFSVTQGQADVYVNGEMVISFGDTIEIINDGQPYYSEKIGNWASTVPDSMFIRGLLFHPYDDVYHYSEKVKRILDAESERLETMNWHIETSDGIKQEMQIREGFEEFLSMAVLQFMTKQWGEVEPEEAEHNNKNPQAAIRAYVFQGEVKVYVKAENGAVRVFLPEEW